LFFFIGSTRQESERIYVLGEKKDKNLLKTSLKKRKKRLGIVFNGFRF